MAKRFDHFHNDDIIPQMSDIGGGGSGGGSGGVIDGTLHFTPTPFTRTFTSGVSQEIYTTVNDCGLFVKISNVPVAGAVQLLIGDKPIFTYADVAGNQVGTGSVIPVKAGTKISAIVTESSAVTHTFTVYEFKLQSLKPQAAFPDWDADKRSANLRDTLVNGNTHTATSSGYIMARLKVTTGLVQLKINSNVVGSWFSLVSVEQSDYITQVIPIAVNDKLTMEKSGTAGPSTDSEVYFYPCKAVEATVTSPVNRIIAGDGISVSPSTGTGDVTISATGGGGGGTVVGGFSAPDWSENGRTEITDLVKSTGTYTEGYPVPYNGFVLFRDLQTNGTAHRIIGKVNSFAIYQSACSSSDEASNQMVVPVCRGDKVQTTGTYGNDFHVYFLKAKSGNEEDDPAAIMTEDGEAILTEDGEVLLTET